MIRLPHARPTAAPRSAFTLVEMLVSLAVLVLALSVVGSVFAITTRTAGQAAAYSEVQGRVRQLFTELRADLDHCQPSESILVLVGRTVPAALDADGLDAGRYYRELVGDPLRVPGGFDPEYSPSPLPPASYLDPQTTQYSDPRADILMLFTNRPTVSAAPPENPTIDTVGQSAALGVKFSPVQVVYGHAAFAEPVLQGNEYEFPDESLAGAYRHIDEQTPTPQSIIPASQWHLARRQMIVGRFDDTSFDPDLDNLFEWKRIVRCQAAIGETGHPTPGDLVEYNFTGLLDRFSPRPGFEPAQNIPYNYFTSGAWPATDQQEIYDLLYYGGAVLNHHVATVLTDVPVELRSNLGVHMLPGCAWFQIEFLMPEDPRNSVLYTDPDPDINNTGANGVGIAGAAPSYATPRWTVVEPGETYVFVPDSAENRASIASQINPANGLPQGRLATFARLDQDPGGDPTDAVQQRIIRTWPYAIRITVRAFDDAGRLEQPVVRTMVHRFE
jgi:prepilin-type N-terminal cleavage/methylation domain-containing protein